MYKSIQLIFSLFLLSCGQNNLTKNPNNLNDHKLLTHNQFLAEVEAFRGNFKKSVPGSKCETSIESTSDFSSQMGINELGNEIECIYGNIIKSTTVLNVRDGFVYEFQEIDKQLIAGAPNACKSNLIFKEVYSIKKDEYSQIALEAFNQLTSNDQNMKNFVKTQGFEFYDLGFNRFKIILSPKNSNNKNKEFELIFNLNNPAIDDCLIEYWYKNNHTTGKKEIIKRKYIFDPKSTAVDLSGIYVTEKVLVYEEDEKYLDYVSTYIFAEDVVWK